VYTINASLALEQQVEGRRLGWPSLWRREARSHFTHSVFSSVSCWLGVQASQVCRTQNEVSEGIESVVVRSCPLAGEMRELVVVTDEEPSERLAGLMARRRRSARVTKNKRKHVTCVTLNNNLICAENANDRFSVMSNTKMLFSD
jgi:hypothetical protein